MDWHAVLGVLSGVVLAAGGMYYVWTMLRGASRPNKVTQVLWLLLAAIQVAALIDVGASWPLILMVVATVNCLVIVILTFAGYGYTKHGPLDYACFALALLSLVGWKITGNPNVAIFLAILTSLLAIAPAIVKTYRYPETEHTGAWAVVTIAALLSLFSTTRFDFANIAIPLYQFVENGIMMGLAYFGQRFKAPTYEN